MARIRFEGRLTEEQFVHVKKVNIGRPVLAVPWIILGAVALMLMVGGYGSVVAHPVRVGGRLGVVLLAATALLVLPRWTIRRQWQTEAWPRATVSGVADESGLEWAGPTMAGRHPWKDLFGQRVAKDVVLVYPKRDRRSFLYFPRSFFADESTWHAFRETLRTRGPARV